MQRWPTADVLVESMRRLGIEQCCCSHTVVRESADPQEIREGNDDILGAMQRYPNIILGQCHVNPAYAQAAQDEITRCVVDGGMVGVKLYFQYRIDEPLQFPIVERCIDLGVHILMHASHPTAPENINSRMRVSSGEHFVEIAKRYPEAMIVCGHIGGGGDWEWQIKALRDAPSVYLDTSGSVIDQGMIERCVRDLGAGRLLFGTDMNHVRGVGKLLDAKITKRQRRKIFGENFKKILDRRRI